MAAEGDEKELDGLTEREETMSGSNWNTSMGQSLENEDEELSQDNQTPSSPHDSGIGESGFYEPRDDTEEVTEEISDELDPDVENMQDEDDQKEMNGESGWRNAAKKAKLEAADQSQRQLLPMSLKAVAYLDINKLEDATIIITNRIAADEGLATNYFRLLRKCYPNLLVYGVSLASI